MTNEEIKTEALALGEWYHEIELFPGFVTPSSFAENSRDQWINTREVRKRLSYTGKIVLDMGTMDGMWAFEAEKLGSKKVYAIDICQNNPKAEARFKLAADALGSRAIYAKVNAHTLRTDSTQLNWPKFDIIQCLGLLYHTQNPMLILNNVAACLKGKGIVLFETACIFDETPTPWMRFNFDYGIYFDQTTYCCPNWVGLKGMLKLVGLDVDESSKSVIKGNISRVAFLAHRNMQPLLPELGMV